MEKRSRADLEKLLPTECPQCGSSDTSKIEDQKGPERSCNSCGAFFGVPPLKRGQAE